jgi:hypothetical protein
MGSFNRPKSNGSRELADPRLNVFHPQTHDPASTALDVWKLALEIDRRLRLRSAGPFFGAFRRVDECAFLANHATKRH